MKKKLFAVLMTMVLVLGMATSVSAEVNSPTGNNKPVNSPTGNNQPVKAEKIDVAWSSSKPWTIEVENVGGHSENYRYDMTVYKDGEILTGDYIEGIFDEKVTYDISYYVAINGEGKYTVEVRVLNCNGWKLEYQGVSSDKTYVEPKQKLEIPTILSVDLETEKVTFNQVEGAEAYEIRQCIMIAGKLRSTTIMKCYDDNLSDGKVVFEAYLLNIDAYKDAYKNEDISIDIRVCAMSKNIDKVAYSDYATYILYENKVTKEEAKENFDEAFKELEDENPGPALEALRGVSNETITELLTTDAEFVEKVVKLDEYLIEELGDSYKGATSETKLVDATKVKVVGVAINGIGYSSVELAFAEPEKKADVDTKYENVVQLDINLLVAGEAMEGLTVPVTITMPIPTGVAKENLVILHYHGDATTPEVIVPTVNADGTMTFIVSGFSTFVVTNEVVEEAPEKPAPEAPKTGDTSGTALVCSLLFLAAGVVLVLKRNSFAK